MNINMSGQEIEVKRFEEKNLCVKKLTEKNKEENNEDRNRKKEKKI